MDVDVAYSTILLHTRKSLTQTFSNVLYFFEMRYERSGHVCLAIKREDCVTDLN